MGMALALALGAFSSRSPSARADSGGSPGGTQPNPPPAAWTGCSAGTKVADKNPGAVHGLFVAGPNQQNMATLPDAFPAIPTYLPSDPTICGASLVIPWSTIDKGPNPSCSAGGVHPLGPAPCGGYQQYDFTYLDAEAEKWTGKGKIVNLIVWGADEKAEDAFGGTVGTDGKITVAQGTPSTPKYVRSNSSLKTVSQASCDKSDAWGTPVYWDSNYQKPWRDFQKALIAYVNSATYAANIGYIRFGIGAGGEDFPVDHFDDGYATDTGCWKAWQNAGLTAKQWLDFSQDAIDYEATLGSKYPLFVAINDFPGASPANLVPDGVASEARLEGMGFGMEGMTADQMTDCQKGQSTYADWCSLFANSSYHGHVPLELQTATKSQPDGTCPPSSTVCTGALPPLLDSMINQAGAQVIELYPQEWLVADDPLWSTYGSYHTKYANALAQAACEVGGQAGALRLGCLPTVPSLGPLP